MIAIGIVLANLTATAVPHAKQLFFEVKFMDDAAICWHMPSVFGK